MQCPCNACDYFLERSAIREYDAGMTREEADAEAIEDVRRLCGDDEAEHVKSELHLHRASE